MFPQAEIGLAAFVVATLVIMGFVGRQIAVQQRRETRADELQAWHLRQLVPT